MTAMTADDLLRLLAEAPISWDGYPMTICSSRYGGVYEGRPFVAFPFDPEIVAETDYAGDDISCATFWHRADQIGLPIGRGYSADEAYEDLERRVSGKGNAHKVVAAGGEEDRVAELRARITRNPKVMGGKPTIRGMRITVGTILSHLAYGCTAEEILADYPYLEKDDIQAALRFAYELYQRVEESGDA